LAKGPKSLPEEASMPELVGHRTLTRDAVASFGCLTGDYARLHFDHDFARTTPYGSGVAHGLLSASLALGAMTLYRPDRLACGDPHAFQAGFEARFDEVVRFDDTLALHCEEQGEAAPSPFEDFAERRSAFEMRNAEGRAVTRGAVSVASTRAEAPRPPELSGEQPEVWARSHSALPEGVGGFRAEDVLERGPRGAAPVRTVTESDVVGYASFVGELNRLYLDAPFAERALFGARIAPPMLCFCLGFAAWLRVLLSVPMQGEATAGHLGDRWRFQAPVFIGDTLEVRYRPLSLRRTRSQPTRGVLTFGLQLLNQHQRLVQTGEVDMMLSMRDSA
jgi:acyl dehydratase